MESSPFVLTFGVELEFIACYNPADYEDKRLENEGKLWKEEYFLLQAKYSDLVCIHMIEILNKHGFPTNEYAEYTNDKVRNFSKWTVESDQSVSSVDASWNWHAIELKTPVLPSGKASLDLIDRAVKLLVSKFRLFTNESCGLHVHVGNENRGFDLRTLKNFCSLITAFDRQLESLHHPSRVENPYARSTRKCCIQGTWEKLSLTEKLFIIDKMETLKDLTIGFHSFKNPDRDPDIKDSDIEDPEYDKNMAYNFLNLWHDKALPTIEFRQHRGTLDPELITQWVIVVCSLVETSYRDEGYFRKLFDKLLANDSIYTVTSLFEDLQLRKQAEFYAPLVRQYGVDQNPAGYLVGEEPAHTDTSFPGQYDTPWEKEFAPRPPCELASSLREAFLPSRSIED